VLQTLFIQRWFRTLDQAALADRLRSDLDGQDLEELTENPLLLTALCVIYLDGRQLPDDLFALYQRICDNVLHNRYLDETHERVPVKGRLEAIAYGMHTGEGLGEARITPEARATADEIERLLRGYANLEGDHEQARIAPAEWREDLFTRSGLLLPQSDGGAAFYHLSIQEFLAAERIAHCRLDDSGLEQVFRDRWHQPEWRLTLLFLFAGEGFHARVGTGRRWRQGLLERLAGNLERSQIQANPAPAVFVANALGLCLLKRDRPSSTLTERMRQVALAAIDDEITVKDRHRLGLCLGLLGDPRIKDLQDPDASIQVPAGDYVYGDDNQPLRIDAPFRLSRYPVTNSQYRAFIEAGGYLERAYWSEQGWAWRKGEGIAEPRHWHDKARNNPSQPVVGVSFYEAEACCRWAGGRLPTEQEWEAAARGPDGCIYPWGDDWEDGICNSGETGLDGTSTVGLFPRSHQRELGIADMAGNVWEWCDSYYEDRDDHDGIGVSRVLRGGAFGELVRVPALFGPGLVRVRGPGQGRRLSLCACPAPPALTLRPIDPLISSNLMPAALLKSLMEMNPPDTEEVTDMPRLSAQQLSALRNDVPITAVLHTLLALGNSRKITCQDYAGVG
jgi:hypothetical protein